MTSEEQLQLWVNGDSVHNDERDECCPDFSCCNQKVNTLRADKQDFIDADDDIRMFMLGDFLAGAFRAEGMEVTTSEDVHD